MIEKHYDYTGYAYCYNNPLNFIDPFGLDAISTSIQQTVTTSGSVVNNNDEITGIDHVTENTGTREISEESVVTTYTKKEYSLSSDSDGNITINGTQKSETTTINKKTGEIIVEIVPETKINFADEKSGKLKEIVNSVSAEKSANNGVSSIILGVNAINNRNTRQTENAGIALGVICGILGTPFGYVGSLVGSGCGSLATKLFTYIDKNSYGRQNANNIQKTHHSKF
jgi:hypothetical protein